MQQYRKKWYGNRYRFELLNLKDRVAEFTLLMIFCFAWICWNKPGFSWHFNSTKYIPTTHLEVKLCQQIAVILFLCMYKNRYIPEHNTHYVVSLSLSLYPIEMLVEKFPRYFFAEIGTNGKGKDGKGDKYSNVHFQIGAFKRCSFLGQCLCAYIFVIAGAYRAYPAYILVIAEKRQRSLAVTVQYTVLKLVIFGL